MRSVSALREELEFLRSRYRVRHVTFKDDVFTLKRERTEELCVMLRSIGISWDCVTRVDTVDKALLSVMKKSGCTGIKIGVETGSERLMKRIDRRLDKEIVRRAASWIRETGMHWTAYFMMGFPGERLDDVEETFTFMKELSPDFASLSGYEAFPGTTLFEDAVSRGIVQETMSREEFFHTSPHDYYLLRGDRGMELPAGMRFDDLEARMQSLFYAHNSSPANLIRRLKSRLSIWRGEPSLFLKDSARFASWFTPFGRKKV